MVSILQQQLGLFQEMLLQIWDLSAYPHGAQGGLAANVGVCACYYRLDFGEQVTSHLNGGDVSKGTKGETDGILVGVVQVTTQTSASKVVLHQETPYFLREFVTSVRTSWFSSSSNMVPR